MNASGTAALPNTVDGIKIFSAGATIGGTAAGAGNVISGNSSAGIEITGVNATGAIVEGNSIGTNTSGTHLFGNNYGVYIHAGASNNTVGGTSAGARNVLDASGVSGIELDDSSTSNNVVEGNYVGLKPDGSSGGVNVYGILVFNATGTIIGGTTPAARNIISANDYGVFLRGGDTTLLEGNYIGTDPTGMIAEGNYYWGVDAYYGSGGSRATIGGLTSAPGTGAGNVISGNGAFGVTPANASNITILDANLQAIEGNIIGLNAAGTAALGVASTGIYVYDTTSSFTIGGTSAGAGNVISGNTGAGIELDGANTSTPGPVENVSIEGNFIGTDITGTIARPNGANGVTITGGSNLNTIGGSTAGARNVISGNTGDGVSITGNNNLVEGNYVGTNAAGTAALANGVGLLIDTGAVGQHRGRHHGDGRQRH